MTTRNRATSLTRRGKNKRAAEASGRARSFSMSSPSQRRRQPLSSSAERSLLGPGQPGSVDRGSAFSLSGSGGVETTHWRDGGRRQVLVRAASLSDADTAAQVSEQLREAGSDFPESIYLTPSAATDRQRLRALLDASSTADARTLDADSPEASALMADTELGPFSTRVLADARTRDGVNRRVARIVVFPRGQALAVKVELEVAPAPASRSLLFSRSTDAAVHSSLRGDTSPTIQVGSRAPTVTQLTLGRVTAIVRDSLALSNTPKARNQRAVHAYTQAVAKPADLDPLGVVPATLQERVSSSIHALSADAGRMTIEQFKARVVAAVEQHPQTVAAPVPTATIEALVDTELGPYANPILAASDDPSIEITQRALDAFRAATARPSRPHPLAPLTEQEQLIEALHQLSGPMSSLSYENLRGIVAANLVSQQILAKTLADEAIPAKLNALQVAVDALMLPHLAATELDIYTDPLRVPNAEIRAAVAAEAQGNAAHRDLLELAAERLNRLDYEARQALPVVDEVQTQALIDALEQMPVVQKMYQDSLVSQQSSGLLLKSLDVLPEAAAQEHFAKQSETLEVRVRTALRAFEALVQADRRPPEDRIATIEVNPDEVSAAGKVEAFRADAARTNDKVRISAQNAPEIIVHELGHQVEFHLSSAEWFDIHQLLRARTSGTALVDIFDNGKEAALNAAMPGFAAKYPKSSVYGAKVYGSGDTEVVSMTLEMFANPEHAREMIRRDPVLAATILRAIQPTEFEATISAGLQDLLPRGRTAL